MSMNQQLSKQAELHRGARVPEVPALCSRQDSRESSTGAEENSSPGRTTNGLSWVYEVAECLQQMKTREPVQNFIEKPMILPTLIDPRITHHHHHHQRPDFRPRRNPRRLARAKTVSYLESTEPDDSPVERAAIPDEKPLTYGSGEGGDSVVRSQRGIRSSVSQFQESDKNPSALDEARNWGEDCRHGDMYQPELELGQEFETYATEEDRTFGTVCSFDFDQRNSRLEESSWTSTYTLNGISRRANLRSTSETNSEFEGNYLQEFVRRGETGNVDHRKNCDTGSDAATLGSRPNGISENINVPGTSGIPGELLHVYSESSRRFSGSGITEDSDLRIEEPFADHAEVQQRTGERRTADDEHPCEDSSRLSKGPHPRYSESGTELRQVLAGDNMQRIDADSPIKNGCKVKPERSKKPAEIEQTDELVLVPFGKSFRPIVNLLNIQRQIN